MILSPSKPMRLLGKKDMDVLHTPSTPVDTVDSSLIELGGKMLATVRAAKGHAIAAIQVGVPKNFIVLNNGEGFINLNPIVFSKKTELSQEGCLSLPGKFLHVRRSTSVTFEFQDLYEMKMSNEFHGLMARVWQHEYDHIVGKLISEQNYKKVVMKSAR